MTASLSVVMPLYNEAGAIEDVLTELERAVVNCWDGPLDVTIVNDASTDGSAVMLGQLSSARPWLHVVHAEHNRGHGPSVRRALELARGDWIFQLDSDGHFDLADFWRLWEVRDRADLVLAVRVHRQDPRHRLLLTRAVRIAVAAVAGRRLADANVPFRLLRREVWEELSPLIGEDALAPSILVAVGAVRRGRRVVQVPVGHRPRTGTGPSTLRRVRLISFSLRALGELLAFRARVGGRGRATMSR
jgi:glycosyltransferase involved in cell wall biosynthesis